MFDAKMLLLSRKSIQQWLKQIRVFCFFFLSLQITRSVEVAASVIGSIAQLCQEDSWSFLVFYHGRRWLLQIETSYPRTLRQKEGGISPVCFLKQTLPKKLLLMFHLPKTVLRSFPWMEGRLRDILWIS